ncbi:MAG TPA: S53 family peptidase, partial [Candidatus Limnocylindrales bacterium]
MSLRSASLGGLAAATFALSLVVSPAVAAPSGRATLAGSVPSWAKAAAFKGSADPNGTVGFRVYLGWTNDTAAAALARAVSDPRSASYGHYLTPAQFRARFAPSASTIASVQNWLKSRGFKVDYSPLNNRYVAAHGTVAQAQAAFGAKIDVYSVQGQLVRSPATALSVPSQFAGVVDAVLGLDDSAQFIHTNHIVADAPPVAGFRNAPPLADFFGQLASSYTFPAGFTADPAGTGTVPWAVRGTTPQQIKSAYGIGSGFDGSGQTVAVIDAFASPTIVSDVNTWSTNRGLPTFKPGQFTQMVAPGTYLRAQNKKQDPQGWSSEETLDIEAVHGMATGANVVYVSAPNAQQDLDAALNHVVDRGLAQIVTNSYGFSGEAVPSGFIKPLNDTFIQAAAEGIGVYFSSGDCGTEVTASSQCTMVGRQPSPDWPASSPWVTAVGGTALGVGASGQRVVETGWGTSSYNCLAAAPFTCTDTGWLYGAGGGLSRIFAAPSYQSALSHATRAVPDVAALADPQTGLLIGQTQTFPSGVAYDEYRIGG